MFSDTFFPQVNGVVTSIASFTKELQAQGHEVEIFAAGKGEDVVRDTKVHWFPAISFKPYPEYQVALMPQGANKLVKQGNFDVIHTHSPAALGWAGVYSAKRNKLPCLSTFHTPISDYVPYLFGGHQRLIYLGKKVAWAYCKKHYNRYDRVITPSKVIRNLLLDQKIKTPISVVKTGIDMNQFKVKDTVSVKEKMGLDKFILHSGRLSFEKNVDVLIRGFSIISKEFPNLKFVITSDGPARPDLEQLVQSLGLEDKVIFTGYFPWEDLDDLYRLYTEAECAVIASEAETQGLVILEAMACGTPVIGADYLAVPETITQHNGMLFEFG